jgi:hypothetical protein
MSKIVTLIPAFKPEFIGELFVGLRTQKFKDFRVVLSDDSPNGEITERIRAGSFGPLERELNLVVVRGPREGSQKNIQHLIGGWGDKAELIHVHLDDDILYPDFYHAHIDAHSRGNWSASVSLRWLTLPDGRPAQDLPLPSFLDDDNARIVPLTADQLYQSTIPYCRNWLGEITNVVLAPEGARRYALSRMGDIPYYGLGDIGVLLDVSRQAPVVVIRDHLSGFRSNPMQSSARLHSTTVKFGHLAWVALAVAAWRDGRITAKQVVESLGHILNRSGDLYTGDPQMEEFFAIVESNSHDLAALANAFAEFWKELVETNPDSRRWTPPGIGIFSATPNSIGNPIAA